MSSRKVTRVLVMLEYGPDDPANGEVFDLTALVSEMKTSSNHYTADINLSVKCQTDWSFGADRKDKLEISWGGDAGNWVHGASHLEDVVNAAMPDGDRVQAIKKRSSRLEKKAHALKMDAMRAKLEQVAAVRHQHPIARVTNAPLATDGESPQIAAAAGGAS